MSMIKTLIAFALVIGVSNFAGAESLFQNDPCDNWHVKTDALFNGEMSAEAKKVKPEELSLFQNDPCNGWWCDTSSLFNYCPK